MPGMEKLAGELFFPTNQQLFLTTWSKELSDRWTFFKQNFCHILTNKAV
jgi:hypothetical protein